MFLEPKLMKTECGGDLLAWGNARFVVRASRKHPNTYTASCRMRSSCTLAENGGKCCQGKFVKNVGGDFDSWIGETPTCCKCENLNRAMKKYKVHAPANALAKMVQRP